MFFAGRGCGDRATTHTTTRIDTVFVRDTLRDTVLVPKIRLSVRTDTVFLNAPGDTVQIGVEVPVERKVYQTADYRAVVEGFRPALVGMELYRNTAIITKETIRAPPRTRWGIGVQAGYGITPKGTLPYLGIGIQYNLVMW